MNKIVGAVSALMLLSNITLAQINKAGSRAAIKLSEVENINIRDLSPAVSEKITYRLIYSEEVLKSFSNTTAKDLNADFTEEMLIVFYNGTGNGKINPLGATYLLKPKYLKVGYSILDKKPFQPYTVVRVKKLDFKRLDVLPYKKYVKSKEKWF